MDKSVESPIIILRDVILDSCRVCMAQNSDMNCVFDPANDNISDKISYCTGLTLSKADGLPTKVCHKCLADLTTAHKFKTSCLLADETFRRVLQNGIKTETDSHGDNYDNNLVFEDDVVKDDVCHDNKVEIQVMLQTVVRRSKGGIKVEKDDISPTLSVVRKKRGTYKCKTTSGNVEVKKRGPYKKDGPKRYKKYKFTKLTCVPCSVKFKTKADYEAHRTDAHQLESDSFMCEICGKVFAHRASHYSHVRSHQPPAYACAHCDYRAGHKHDLVKHIRIHTGTKLYQCEFCSRSYYTSSNLTSHIRQAHRRERKHHCTICPKAFFDRTKLNRHVDSHNDIKRYQCEVCQSGFTRRCYWKKHLERQHSIVIPPQRPGRQKVNVLVGEDSRKNAANEKSLNRSSLVSQA